MSLLDSSAVRSRFPALLSDDCIYTDNAGGTQVLASVIDYISNYYTHTNAQLGGLYSVSKSSSAAVQRGADAGAEFINASPDEVVYGSSTTQLFTNLSLALDVMPGDELIISEMDHEANIAPWLRLASIRGLKVVPWRVRNETQELHLDDLKQLLSPKTRLVTLTHSSNMLGTINPIKEIAAIVHGHSSAQIVADGVAYAPHRRIDVADLGVDFYCFSWYKVYGPHVAMLYASSEAQKRLTSLGHYFHTGTDLATYLGLAGGAYEFQSSIPLVVEHLKQIGGGDLNNAFDLIKSHEEEMQKIIMGYMLSKPNTYRIYGSQSTSGVDRMPLISFTVQGRPCSEIVAEVHKRSKFSIRNGHMYSKRLMDQLGCDGEYAIRISLCHYNSVQEAKDFVALLEQIVSS